EHSSSGKRLAINTFTDKTLSLHSSLLSDPFSNSVVYARNLDPYRATKPPGRIVGFCAVVIHEDIAVAVISKDGATKFSDISWCYYPARCFGVEISKFLQLPILFFR